MDDPPGNAPAVIGASQVVGVDDAGDTAALQQAQTFGAGPQFLARAFGHDDVRRMVGSRVSGDAEVGRDRVQPDDRVGAEDAAAQIASSVRDQALKLLSMVRTWS
jgi:hypothetical protein